MESYLKKQLVYGHGNFAVNPQIIVYMALEELSYQNDEDACWKFENYPLMETKLDLV